MPDQSTQFLKYSIGLVIVAVAIYAGFYFYPELTAKLATVDVDLKEVSFSTLF